MRNAAQSRKFWQDRRVLVTGCTGLVGSWTVAALLERGAHVVGLVRDHVAGCVLNQNGLFDRMDRVAGSVEDELLLERAIGEYEIQTVLHLAAQAIVGVANRNPLATFETNIRGTWCVLEAARRSNLSPQVIVASSDKAYGDHGGRPYTEESALLARHPYDASKACADILALSYHHSFGLPVCVTRCGNFFGGGDLNWNRIVPGAIRDVLRGRQPVIRSDGQYIRDYFYVKDGAGAYLHLAECLAADDSLAGEAFNFSNESQVTVLEMVDRICGQLGSGLKPLVQGRASNEIRSQCLSAEKARKRLGWQPEYDLDSALGETVAWYRDFLELPVVDARPGARAA